MYWTETWISRAMPSFNRSRSFLDAFGIVSSLINSGNYSIADGLAMASRISAGEGCQEAEDAEGGEHEIGGTGGGPGRPPPAQEPGPPLRADREEQHHHRHADSHPRGPHRGKGPVARPYCFRSTEPMMALVLGDEKNPSPSPITPRRPGHTPSGCRPPAGRASTGPDRQRHPGGGHQAGLDAVGEASRQRRGQAITSGWARQDEAGLARVHPRIDWR